MRIGDREAGINVWRVALVCGAAYGSHLVFDWLGADNSPPFGIQAFWPLSDGWYLSGWDLFLATQRRHFLTAAVVVANTRTVLREIAVLGPVLVVLWLVRVKAAARFPAEASRRHHAAQ